MASIDRIWVVDDDEIYVFTARMTCKLEGFGQQVDVFTNGKEAFDQLASLQQDTAKLPDLILLDLNMPIWDGWNFLDELARLTLAKRPLIFIVSSSIHPDDQEKAKQYDAVTGFLFKPLNLQDLRQQLTSLR